MPASADFGNWSCPLPLRDYPNIVLGHGGGGRLSAELMENLFLPALGNETLATLRDSSLLDLPPGRVAFTTDSFVVRPLFFPGGSIGELAVYGTVNDLAMSGARPLYLSVGFILEEGLAMPVLAEIVARLAAAAREAGVQIAAGDTKVVEKGHGDGCFLNTTGIGIVMDGVDVAPDRARGGDVVLVSGTIGDHGMAILSVREGLEFETVIRSDCAPLHTLVDALLPYKAGLHVLRDPTRGGLATCLNEIAERSRTGIVLDESAVPVDPAVQAACDLLGLDPLSVANEGKLIAITSADVAEPVLQAMRSHPLGRRAAVIGRVTDQHAGTLAARTPVGGTRIIPMPVGEQLPRIC